MSTMTLNQVDLDSAVMNAVNSCLPAKSAIAARVAETVCKEIQKHIRQVNTQEITRDEDEEIDLLDLMSENKPDDVERLSLIFSEWALTHECQLKQAYAITADEKKVEWIEAPTRLKARTVYVTVPSSRFRAGEIKLFTKDDYQSLLASRGIVVDESTSFQFNASSENNPFEAWVTADVDSSAFNCAPSTVRERQEF